VKCCEGRSHEALNSSGNHKHCDRSGIPPAVDQPSHLKITGQEAHGVCSRYLSAQKRQREDACIVVQDYILPGYNNPSYRVAAKPESYRTDAQ
jgi:hypothetical protein